MTTTTTDPESTLQAAAAELAQATARYQTILSDPDAFTGADLYAAKGDQELAQSRHGIAAERHRIASEAAQVAERDRFAATIKPTMDSEDETVLLAIESVEAAINRFLSASAHVKPRGARSRRLPTVSA
jgi:hypothetical protein